MLSNSKKSGSSSEIEVLLHTGDFRAIDAAWESLIRALVDNRADSPEQVLAWDNGVAGLPTPLRDLLPSLARLNELAAKAWPTNKD